MTVDYDGMKPSGGKFADRERANRLINLWYGWFHENADLTARDQDIVRSMMPVDYTNWAVEFPFFVDDPSALPDDSNPLAPTPPAPPPVRVAMMTRSHASVASRALHASTNEVSESMVPLAVASHHAPPDTQAMQHEETPIDSGLPSPVSEPKAAFEAMQTQ